MNCWHRQHGTVQWQQVKQLLDNLSYLDPDEAKLVVRVELWSWPRHPRWLADLFSGRQVGGVLTDLVADVCRHRPVQRQILEHHTWMFKVQFKGQYHNIGGGGGGGGQLRDQRQYVFILATENRHLIHFDESFLQCRVLYQGDIGIF